MATQMTQEDINFLRLAGLLIRIAPCAVRQRFDFEFDPVTLQKFLRKNRPEIEELRRKRVITKAQYDLLYPKASSETFDVSLMVCLMRAFTDLDIHDALPVEQIHDAWADISRIKFYRNYIVHSNSGKVTEDEFTEIWNCVVGAILRLVPDLKPEVDALMGLPLTNVEEIKHVIRLEKQLENTCQRLEKVEIENNNIAEIRHAKLKEWRDTDMTYVSTSAMTFIQETLQHHMAVIITGSPGCGKSAVAHHAAFQLEKEGFEIIPFDEPSEIQKNFITMKMQVFVIDDVCGKFSLNQHEANSWEKNNFALDRLIASCNKNDNISKCSAKFIFTSRENIYTHKKFPKLTCFSLVQCSFSTKHKISNVEMRKIAQSYLSDETVDDIQNICLYDFFPLLCALYSTMDHPDQRFFIHPIDVIEKEISEMKIKSEPSFLCLSLLVLNNNKYCKDDLRSKDVKHLLEEICIYNDIESDVTIVAIQKSFESFKGIYISESDQSYKAIHDKMFDIISAAIAPSIMECLIKYVDIGFLANRIQLSSLGKSSISFVIYVPPSLEKMYLQRQYDEVKNRKYWEVFGSLQTENEAYRNKLLSFLKDQDTIQSISYVCQDDGVSPLFVSSYLGYVNFVHYFIVKSPMFTDAKDNYGRSAFHVACGNGHIETVKYLLKCCVDKTIKDADGFSALHAACSGGHTEIVKLLIDVGMSINDTTNNIASSLHLVCVHGHYDTARFLLDINQSIVNRCVDIKIKNIDGLSALHAACLRGHTEIVKLLIDVGMNMNDTMNDGATPLVLAAAEGHHETVKFLINSIGQGCEDLFVKDSNGWTALHKACMFGHTEVVKMLIDVGFNVNDTTNNGFTPWFLACGQGHYKTVKILLDSHGQTSNIFLDLVIKDSHGRGMTALQHACFNGHTEVVKMLIDAGMNVNDTLNPLHIACHYGHHETVKLLLDFNCKFLNSFVDILFKDSKGFTLLHNACQNGHTEIVKIMVDAGMDVNDITRDGYTPLFLACQEGHYEIVKYLLDLNEVHVGAAEACICLPNVTRTVNTELKNELGSTALHVACLKGHTEIVKLLVNAGMNINDATKMGFTPLFVACQRGHYDTVKFLLDLHHRSLSSDLTISTTDSSVNISLPNLPSSVNTTIRDPLGMSALHIACSNGYAGVAKLLIDIGMDINDVTYDGKTALYLACLNGHCDVVRMLMNNGAQLDIYNKQAPSPLMIAKTNGQTDIVELLENIV